MKEINRNEQNYELNINKRNEYWNQLNQIKLALGNRLQCWLLLKNTFLRVYLQGNIIFTVQQLQIMFNSWKMGHSSSRPDQKAQRL
jgi:hypothetical protein